MKWIVHLTVVLLNILWVAFFLTDPLAVFVQKRSFSDYDEDMIVGEFCLQTPSDLMWTSTPGPSDVSADKTRTTSDAIRERTNTPNEYHSVSKTPTEPNYLNSSQQSDIRASTAAGEPPSIASTVRDLNEATTALIPLQTWTSSELEVISSSTSEAAPVTATKSSTAPPTQRQNQDHRDIKYCRCISFVKFVRPSLIKEFEYIKATPFCRRNALIVTMKSGQKICLDPDVGVGQRIMKLINSRSKTHEASQPDRRASTVRDLNEATTALIPLQMSTSSELEVISSSTWEVAPVTATKSSTAPPTQRQNQDHRDISRCPCSSFAKIIFITHMEGNRVHKATPWCPWDIFIMTTKSGQEICLDPDTRQSQMILKRIKDSRSFAV